MCEPVWLEVLEMVADERISETVFVAVGLELCEQRLTNVHSSASHRIELHEFATSGLSGLNGASDGRCDLVNPNRQTPIFVKVSNYLARGPLLDLADVEKIYLPFQMLRQIRRVCQE